MGTWGAGIYDNDDAADWAAEVAEDGLMAVRSALGVALESEYIESPEGACALAAADVVARLKSGGGEQTPYCEAVVEWVAANPGSPSDELLDMARRAITRVKGDDSELAELWSEDDDGHAEWLAMIAEVEQRLLP